jgi:hypothetical protein
MALSTTDNGAVALKSTSNVIVDFFSMFLRCIDTELMSDYLEKCWKTDPRKTVAIIFNARDREAGKKEKNISNRAMIWLRRNKQNTYLKNIHKYVTKYGCWKDITYIARKNPINNHLELNLITNQLRLDYQNLKTGKNNEVSLCAKWCPSERDKNDKEFGMASKVADELFPNDTKKMEKYRKEIIVPLRKQIKIVEQLMTSNRWKQIQYDKVPAVASKRLRNAFMKHDPDGYNDFLQKVARGEKKIKITGILPHELVGYYLKNNVTSPDETIELQWKTLVEATKNLGTLNNILPIVDVSGSMYSTPANVPPIYVSIALGILIAECNTGPLHRKVVSFHKEPSIFSIKGETLFEQVNNLSKISAGLNTNFEAVFDLLLNAAEMFNINQENMPDMVVVLSDMQYDEASNNVTENTLHNSILTKYETKGYNPPKFIYWNLSSQHDETFPVKSVTDNVAIISGFSEQLLKVFINSDDFNPESIVNEILSKYENEIEIDPVDI